MTLKLVAAPPHATLWKSWHWFPGNQDLRDRRQANQLLVSQVKAFEGLVMNEQAPPYVRAFAWFKWVELWGCLRYSDTEGMPAKAIVVDERALRRREQAGRLRCSMLMFLLQLGWWNHAGSEWVGSFGKPWVMRQLLLHVIFFLLRPAAGLQGCAARMARCYHASAMSQALFRELRTDGVGGRGLMTLGLGVLWSEHSACYHVELGGLLSRLESWRASS